MLPRKALSRSLSLIKEIKSFDEDFHTKEEKEEIFFVARKLITEISSPWIRRTMLDEELYSELYRDLQFEPKVYHVNRVTL